MSLSDVKSSCTVDVEGMKTVLKPGETVSGDAQVSEYVQVNERVRETMNRDTASTFTLEDTSLIGTEQLHNFH